MSKNKVIIAPSMLSADFANLDMDLKSVEASDSEAWLHVDIMDGHFVPNLTIGPGQVKCIRKSVSIPFDVHLMITSPLSYIQAFAEAGADLITVHVECEDDIFSCIEMIHKCGKKAGIVLSPDTPVSEIIPYLDDIQMILVMSVYPGFGGQKFIPESLNRLREIRSLIGSRDIRLEIDGGINQDTLPEVLKAGADTIVSGSCLFKGDIAENIQSFKRIINKFEN